MELTKKEEQELCQQKAQVAFEQIFMSCSVDDYLSWGISAKACAMYREMPTLMLKVSGLIHKGWVFVSYNEGADLYEVRLLNGVRTKVVRTETDVYCDCLGSLIDSMVEKPLEMSDEEYFIAANKDSAEKLKIELQGITEG